MCVCVFLYVCVCECVFLCVCVRVCERYSTIQLSKHESSLIVDKVQGCQSTHGCIMVWTSSFVVDLK